MVRITNILFYKLLVFLLLKNVITENNENQNIDIFVDNKIDNAIYVIRNKNRDRNLDMNKKLPVFVNNVKRPLKKHFRIYEVDKNSRLPLLNISSLNASESYYCIEDKDFHLKLGIFDNKVQFTEVNEKSPIEDKFLWKLIPKIIEGKVDNKTWKKVFYSMFNIGTQSFLSHKQTGLVDIFEINEKIDIKNLEEKHYFTFNKMYREKKPDESKEILEKEPIDVLIKYIDLSDPNLKREGIPQIKKDEDNGEILFSVRSILKNIPWIRKIFILMPNEKVKYFKEPELIKERIVYVKDKDLIGFDSASSPVFQLNLWKMKKFNLSENFLLMDDDCFIARPLNKSNFFYEDNGKVYPALVTGDYYELSQKNLEEKVKKLKEKIKKGDSHTPNGFNIMQSSTLLFLYSIFGEDEKRNGKPLIEPAFSHNTIPVKQSDIKEIYDYIAEKYPYANETLKAKSRELYSIQPQTIFMAYPKNKYDRRVKIITSSFYDLTQFKGKTNSQLFVVNTSDKKYLEKYFKQEIDGLTKLFPEKTKYEIDYIKSEQTQIGKINDKNNNGNNNNNI